MEINYWISFNYLKSLGNMMNGSFLLKKKVVLLANLLKYLYVVKVKKEEIYDYLGYSKLDDEKLFDAIKVAIENELPLCIGKIGGSESYALEAMTFGRKEKEAYKQLCNWSGFFPKEYTERDFSYYYQEQAKAISQIDIIIYYPKKYEMFFLRKFISHKICWCEWITPWMIEKQWMTLLQGKNVLVIHPYAELIEKQYAKRKLLFQDADMLPEFNLYTIKAVQTIGNIIDERFSTWMEALEYMENEARKINFDVALIGCGAYGLPLAARIKKMGKIGIHCGGELQTYFGIRGKRWDEGFPDAMKKITNEYWTRPEILEENDQLEQVEKGCYL